jgi:hypothetical protein
VRGAVDVAFDKPVLLPVPVEKADTVNPLTPKAQA